MSEEITNERSKEDLLKILHSISYWAFLTDLCTEMCYEVTEYTSKGASYYWIAYNDWNFFKLNAMDSKKWLEIRSKLNIQELDIEDIEGTILEKLVDYIKEKDGQNTENLPILFGDLLKLPETIEGPIYCYYDTVCHFALSEEEIKKTVGDIIGCSTRWEDLSLEQLEECVWLFESDGPDIPLVVFDE